MLTKDKLNLLKKLKRLKVNQFRHFIRHADNRQIDDICECVYNTIHNEHLKIDPFYINKIKNCLSKKKSKKNVRLIANKKTSYIKKRAALTQEGRGIGLIISALAPLLANLFT